MLWETVSKTLLKVETIHSLSLIPLAGLLVIQKDQVGQTGPAFPKFTLARSDSVVLLFMMCDCIQDNLLHNLPSIKIRLRGLQFPGSSFWPWVTHWPTSSHLWSPWLIKTGDKWLRVVWWALPPAPSVCFGTYINWNWWDWFRKSKVSYGLGESNECSVYVSLHLALSNPECWVCNTS